MPTYAYRCKRCTKSFEVVLTVAERAAAKVACPTCGGGEVTPQMAIFSARPLERAEGSYVPTRGGRLPAGASRVQGDREPSPPREPRRPVR